MPMANHLDNNARPGITYNDAAAVKLPIIHVNNNASDDGNSKGHITSAAEGRWVKAAANYRSQIVAPERAAGFGVLSTLPPPSPPPSPPQRAKRTRTTVRARLSADAARLQRSPAQVPADRAPDANTSRGMLPISPPPSPPPAPPVQRASWVGDVRFSELSPADAKLHDDFTAVVIREAAEA